MLSLFQLKCHYTLKNYFQGPFLCHDDSNLNSTLLLFSERKLFGSAIWFRLHQLFVGLAILLTLVGFVVIGADRGTAPLLPERLRMNPHPLFGLLTFILCFLQPLMAALRPSPDAERRWLFNWAHWAAGNLAWMLALVAIFLAGDFAFLRTEDWYWRLGFFCAIHVLVHLALTLEKCLNANKSVVEDISLPAYGQGHDYEASSQGERGSSVQLKPGNNQAGSGGAVKIILGLSYVVFVWLFAGHLCAVVGLSEAGGTGFFGNL